MSSKLLRWIASPLVIATLLVGFAEMPARAAADFTVAPSAGGLGANDMTVTIGGLDVLTATNVTADQIVFSGSGVTVNSILARRALAGEVDIDVTVSPSAATSARDIVINGSLTCTTCFTVHVAPVITGASPSSLEQGASSQPVTFTGTGFASGMTIAISGGGVTVGSPTSLTSTSITVPVSVDVGAATASRSVSPTNSDNGTSTCPGCFSVTKRIPHITDVSPSTIGQGASNFDVTVTGSNFDSGIASAVSGTGITVATHRDSSTQIRITVSVAGNAPLTSRDITLTNMDTGVGGCTACVTVIPPPAASSFTPAQRGQGLTNQTITIAGVGFTPQTLITFSGTGIKKNSIVYSDATKHLLLNIDVAADAPVGMRDVTFTNVDGTHSTCAGCFAVTDLTTAALTAPTTVGGAFVATFTHDVANVPGSNFYVRVSGGSSNIAASISCKTVLGVSTSCSSGSARTATLMPTSPLVAGQAYTATLTGVMDLGGLIVPVQNTDFRSTTEQAESTDGESFTWFIVKNAAASGGSYALEHLAGARASFVFTGSSITWWTNKGPNYGVAYVYVDGVYKGAVNLYASSMQYRRGYNISGFPYGKHTLMIVVHGTKSSASKGTNVAVDAFTVGYNGYNTPTLKYGWSSVSASSASGGHYVRANYSGESSTFTFKGTRIVWYTVLGTSMGKANVYIDGVLKGAFDNYSASALYGYHRTFSGLADKVHTIKIVVLGTHRTASHGSYIAIDRWSV